MKNLAVYLLLSILFLTISCSEGEKSVQNDETSKTPSSKFEEKSMDETLSRKAGAVDKEKSKKQKNKKKDTSGEDSLESTFFKPMELAKDRLLEYNVNLTYRCENLQESRRNLLEILSEYGFIKSSNSNAEYNNLYMTTDLFIKSDSLYKALIDFDILGNLLKEKINAYDHTEKMVLNQRKIKREEIRIQRKNRSITKVAPANKNWQERENSLERSEDRLDASKHGEWKIKDKVKWAKIHIYLKGPEKAEGVKIPNYMNALLGTINMLLNLLYIIIYLLPFIVIVSLFIWKRKSIMRIFKRKE